MRQQDEDQHQDVGHRKHQRDEEPQYADHHNQFHLDERLEQVQCGDHRAAGAQGDPWHSSGDRAAGAQGDPSGSLDDRGAEGPDEQWGQPVLHQSKPDAAENQFDQWQEDEEPRVSHRGVFREA
jgi:hypothetical protein